MTAHERPFMRIPTLVVAAACFGVCVSGLAGIGEINFWLYSIL